MKPKKDSLSYLNHWPKLDDGVDSLARDLRTTSPKVDVTSQSRKVRFLPLKQVQPFYFTVKADVLKSFFVHGFALASYFIFSFFSWNFAPAPNVVEVSFGLTEKIVQTNADVSSKEPHGLQEATKTKEDLTQLTKAAQPDSNAQDSQGNNQAKQLKQDALTFEEPKHQAAKNKNVDNPSKKLAHDEKNDPQKISQKEFLKRKEEDLRKVAAQKQQGVHRTVENQPKGQKHTSSALPKSPFQSAESLPDAPPGLAPTGDEKGVDEQNYNAYKIYLKNQLRLNWNTDATSEFSNSLSAVVEFTINPFGLLIHDVKIVQSSKNTSFDALVIKSVKETFPVGTPPPKSIHPPQTFRATYSAKNVR